MQTTLEVLQQLAEPPKMKRKAWYWCNRCRSYVWSDGEECPTRHFSTLTAERPVGEINPGRPLRSGVAEAETPTWQVSLKASHTLAGVKTTLDGFVSGATKEEAIENFLNELRLQLQDGANWTPWNAAAKAEEEASYGPPSSRRDLRRHQRRGALSIPPKRGR